jgi:hypothetical protein
MVIVPQPPYSLPCDFIWFPKLKMKLKGWRFETVSDIQRELQVVLNSIKENDFHCAFEAWKNGISIYVPKDKAARIKLSQHYFDLVCELSDMTITKG